ncbi:MAG: hypothetical protein GY884_15175, partial [Proteobacteria bacterium]|nr:hypothetical protein [Pseudomonadota bacterium]
MRPDLALLVDDVLVDLANKGLVKRAHKLVGKGEPTVSWDGVVPTGTFSDGVVSSLPQDTGLADSPCSCAASGVCRHRLALVVACRSEAPPAVTEAWTPAFSDAELESLLGAPLVARAERHQAGVVVELVPGPPPTARLPTCTVRFLVEGELGYASCDCDEPKCEHVAHAVWAFRRGGERVELAPSQAVVDTAPLDELVGLTD